MNTQEKQDHFLGIYFSTYLPEGRPSFDIDPLYLCRVREVCVRWKEICDRPSSNNPFLDIYKRQFSVKVPENIENAYHFYMQTREDWEESRGGDVDALVYAIYRGWDRQIGFLLNRGIDYNGKAMCLSNCVNLESWSCKYEPDGLIPSNSAYTPLQMAIRVGDIETSESLMKIPGIDKVNSGTSIPLLEQAAARALYWNPQILPIVKKLAEVSEAIFDADEFFLAPRQMLSVEIACQLIKILKDLKNIFKFIDLTIQNARYFKMEHFPLIELAHEYWLEGKITDDNIFNILHVVKDQDKLIFLDRTPQLYKYRKILAHLRQVERRCDITDERASKRQKKEDNS